ncbi:MAG: hypothetical protein QXK26_02085 [Candidatus Bathyarchaeia archaeon]
MINNRVELLSDKTLVKLNNGLSQLYDLVEDGVSPNEALKKVAEFHNLTPDQLRCVSYAFNSGMTNYYIHHEKNAKQLYHKHLCDPEQVITSLYGSGAKKKASEEISEFYLHTPTTNRIFDDVSFSEHKVNEPKTASIKQDRSVSSLSREAMALFHKMASRKEALENEYNMLCYAVERDLNKIKDYFSTTYAIHPKIVEANCQVVSLPAESILKQAGIVVRNRPYSDDTVFDEKKEPYLYISRINEFAKKASVIKKKIAEMDEQISIIKKRLQKIASEDSSHKKPTHTKEPPKSLVDQFLPGQKEKSTLEEIFGKEQVSFADQEGPQVVKAPLSIKEVLTTNSNEIKLWLTKLMQDDPIISQYSPEEVITAYDKIIKLVPGLATKEQVVVPLLRKILASGGEIDMVELKLLAEAAKFIKTMDQN